VSFDPHFVLKLAGQSVPFWPLTGAHVAAALVGDLAAAVAIQCGA
jgi:hypothetical protein